MAENIPSANPKIADDHLCPTEVITRMMQVIYNFQTWDLKELRWDQTFAENKIDSLDATALLTSIEHEFHIVFEDRVFENFENLNQVRDWVARDHHSF